MNSNLAGQDYWEETYSGQGPRIAAADDEVRMFVERHCPPGIGRAFEVGCYPGQYLAVLGQLGYELNGIDLVPRSETELPQFFNAQGFKVGQFRCQDFLADDPSPVYDVVCSFGFIEHFPNWADVLAKHCEYLKPGGLLLIETPNFRTGIQYPLHAFFDRKNLQHHHVPSMNPGRWSKVVRRLGFTVEWWGFFGRYDFWANAEERSQAKLRMLLALHTYRDRLRKLPPNNRLYAPFCGMAAYKGQ